MKKKELLVVFILVITIISGGVIVWKRKIPFIPAVIPPATSYKTYPSIFNLNFYPIREIKQQGFEPGSYNTEGYVVKIFTCPPCPTGAVCEPCMGENIVISEENEILDDYYSLTEKELFLFVQSPEQFKLGKKYQFSLKVTGKESSFGLNNQPILDIELLGYE